MGWIEGNLGILANVIDNVGREEATDTRDNQFRLDGLGLIDFPCRKAQ